MSQLIDYLEIAPARPIYSNDRAPDQRSAPRVATPENYFDAVDTYSFFHGLGGLELAARRFRGAKPEATRNEFVRHITAEMGR